MCIFVMITKNTTHLYIRKATPFHNEVAKNIYLNKEKKFILQLL